MVRLVYLAARVRQLAGDLHRRATHDPLTGLPNRAALDDAMAELVMDDAGLLMIDLDRFKAVNDTLGHAASDQLLILVSRRIATACGAGWDVFRLAGDEFVAISTSTVVLDDVVATGKRVVERLSLPFHLDGREAWLGASVGAAVNAMALALPLATLAEVTSVVLLSVFVVVNLALITLKRREPNAPFRVPSAVPMLGLVSALAALAVTVRGHMV